ncbi:MAG: LPS export ABC transporter permease LptF [Magnetococcales bacterium]|nr:LPS export ABC transporter permease LptF [Magnetococcales bacterium]
MKRLSRYLLAECGWSALIALTVLTALVLLPQSLKLVDLWVNRNVSIDVLLTMTLLIIPKFLVASLPMALLLGVLLALGRLSQDSEMVVMRASGISLYQIARPIAILVTAATLLSLWLNWVWVPRSFNLFNQMKNALLASNTLAIRTGTFNQALPGLTLYVQEQSEGGRRLAGILIHDRREEDKPTTLIAREGLLHVNAQGNTALFLRDGSRQQKLPNNRFRRLEFATYDLDLGMINGPAAHQGTTKLAALGMTELHAALDSPDVSRAYEARMEWHRRLVIPIATLILGFLAIPMGLQQSNRIGRSYGIVVAVLLLVIHFLLLTSGEALARRRMADPLVAMWLPNLAMAVFTVHVTLATARDRPFLLAVGIARLLRSLARFLQQPRRHTRMGKGRP